MGGQHQDSELQAALARDGLHGLDQLLSGLRPDEKLAARGMGALVRLIVQARRAGSGRA